MRNTIEMAREAGLEGMTGHPALQRLVALARADEREACAALCETECAQNDGITCAEEIRARGQA
jgi:hypothetical protein